jgi:folate-binding protein YgfZ
MPPLQEYHHRHAQHWVDLFGYRIPLYYSTPQEEYQSARRAAMMDAGFFGKLRVSGKDRESLLHRLTANEMRNMKAGESRVNIFTNAKGRVVDRVEMLAEEDGYLFLTSPGRSATLQKWIEKYTFVEDVQAIDLTPQLGMINLFGTESAAKLERLFGIQLTDIPPGHYLKVPRQNGEILAHYPEAANPARFNLITSHESVSALWQALLSEFEAVGFSTFETLRISQGIPVADHEIVDEYNPHEIGLYPFINFDKGCYIGQEVVARLDSYQKVQRQLIGVKSEAAARALEGAAIWQGEHEAGKLTSVAPAPRGEGAIGLAVVRKSFAQPNTGVELRRENVSYQATLVSIPFND